MGIRRMGPPDELILQINKVLGSKCFIETGTFRGDTAKWASNHFESVITIENSLEIYKETTGRLSGIRNIDFRFGHTIEQLGKIVPALDSAGIFWLDAHWCGGPSYGRQDECPVIAEVQIINNSEYPHCILIDDARLFMEPPPYPHDIGSWPDITALLNAMNGKRGRYIVIRDDVIIAVPETVKAIVQEYCRSSKPAPTANEMIRSGINLTMSGIGELFSGR